MKRFSRQTFLAILLTFLTFAVRVYNLGGDSLWIDELITLWDSIQGWQWMVSIEDHPPLLYILTWLSVGVFGESEFTLRLPSLFAGVLSAPLIYALARRFGFGRAGLIAMLLLALSPFHLHYAQEARHYALLMTLSLASFLWLHRAMSRPTPVAWLGYGVLTALNLYTHYAALVVLGAQALLIAGWSLREIGLRRPRRLLLPATGALTVLVLYAPWLPRLWQAMQRNVAGQRDTVANRGSPFSAWVTETVRALGGNDQFYAIVLSLLALAGLFLLLRRRAWSDLSLSLVALFLPLPLIFVLGVSRSANPRYVIYLLPFYLLLVGLGIVWIASGLGGRIQGLSTRMVLALAALGVGTLMIPQVQEEYAAVEQDWRGVARDVAAITDEGDIVLTAVLSLPVGYNIAHDGLVYYLRGAASDLHVLKGSNLAPADTLDLQNVDADIFAVVMYWDGGGQLAGPDVEAQSYQEGIFLLKFPRAQGTALQKVAAVYDRLLPLAEPDVVRCLMMQDLVTINLNLAREVAAGELLVDLLDVCPQPPVPRLSHLREAAVEATRQALDRRLAQASEGSTERERRLITSVLLALEGNEDQAQEAVTVFDLTEMVTAEATMISTQAPEPVDVFPYKMPYETEDAAPALLLHPPAEVSFRLELPPEPTALNTQVGMFADSWEWGGDGSTFVVHLTDAEGNTGELWRKHVSNSAADRYWHPLEISLSDYGGQTVTLTLETEPGPDGSETGDWALWRWPRIVWQP